MKSVLRNLQSGQLSDVVKSARLNAADLIVIKRPAYSHSSFIVMNLYSAYYKKKTDAKVA